MEPDQHAAVLSFLEQRQEPQRYVVLPSEGRVEGYALNGNQKRSGWQLDPGTRVARTPDDTVDGPYQEGVLVGRHTSVFGDRAAVLQRYGSGGHVAIHDLERRSKLGEIPIPDGATPMSVLLLGDFVFVGGDRVGMFWLGGDQTKWHALELPAGLVTPNKSIDYLGICADRLWAIDDVVSPVYAAAYDLRSSRFDEQPETFVFDETVNPTVCAFAANDELLVTAVEVRSGWVGYSFDVTVYENDMSRVVARYSTEPSRDVGRRRIRGAGLLGRMLFVAWGMSGLLCSDLTRLGPDGLIEWRDPIQAEGDVIGVVCVENPPRVFATVEKPGRVGWQELSLDTWQFE